MLNPTEQDLASVPSTLTKMTMQDDDLACLGKCHWRSSGLKSHRANGDDSNRYLFRYCYPQNDNDYASSTGAAVWTKREEDGNEDFSVRILHIYTTTKRLNSESSINPPKKKKAKTRSSSIVPVATRPSTMPYVSPVDDDIHPLMKGELITTPTRTYEDYSGVTVGAHENCFDPQCFDETTLPRVSMSPGTNLRSFAIKVGCLTQDVLTSDREHQPFMVEMLRQQLVALSAVDTKR